MVGPSGLGQQPVDGAGAAVLALVACEGVELLGRRDDTEDVESDAAKESVVVGERGGLDGRGTEFGLASVCAAGGNGAAIVLELLP